MATTTTAAAPTGVATPRINGASLSAFVGSLVRVVGEVVDKTGAVSLRTCDGHTVTVQSQDPMLYSTKFVEVIGHVSPELSIREAKVIPFGDSFNLELYSKVVGHTLKHRAVFG
ncbi:uncharacterized protein AMSG_02631 [Thecamonas trahens ATCC 50062]|uniref:Replication factor A protein 3 n=1 Tax=Thecamonas trahens ATCC 50062 TaxID=461836 RepID=A0A0L0D5G6_THETB|nr:hypothetical protein AMSG_02631 [Thecamonas trahens ATCC 50062]KNC47607.1 hypothetical protein AMSG_02631 [Thecamonas trahens ATCC 50062]|eukprot:XP_013759532.1 hypothetical protein AMSG_02631 [Thecamonas trahens ATCC 50062]